MSEKITFYVLIPVYNVEKYIANCIESVLKQTYQNFKMVIVDDGSPDKAGEICDEYAKKDKRIKVIHQANTGLIAARRKAIGYVKDTVKDKNSYVIFLDSDDSLKSNALQRIYQAITDENSDMIIYGMDRVIGDNVISSRIQQKEYAGVLSDKGTLYKIFFCNQAFNPLCRKAVLLDLLTNDDYSNYYNIYRGEDLLQDIEIYKNCKKVLFIPDKLYNYTINPNSITQNITYDNYRYNSIVRMCVWNFLENEGVWTKKEWNEYIKCCKKGFSQEIKMVMSFDTSHKNKIKILNQIKSGAYYQKIRGNINVCDGALFLLNINQYHLLFIYVNIIKLFCKLLKGIRKIFRSLYNFNI